MKVLLDATSLPPQLVGAGTYIVELARALQVAGLDLNLIARSSELPGRVHETSVKTRPLRLLWEQTILPLRAKAIGYDVFHGPHYTIPRWLKGPAVVTFHDPTFYTHPQLHERSKVTYLARLGRASIARATRVIAVSNYAAEGAVSHGGADPAQVDVTMLGADLDRYKPSTDAFEDSRVRRSLGITDPYILWVGALEPRKDVPTLIEAFRTLGSPKHRLVLCGPEAWGIKAIENAIESSGLSDRIMRTGYVTENCKISLYRGASVFCYPSIAEGFGLPVLEAMACGTPVVTTTGSAMEEVGGNAVVTVTPQDPQALAKALGQVLDDESLAAKLSVKGLERATRFTWQATASATIKSYEKCLSNPRKTLPPA